MHLSIKNKGPVTPKKNRVTAYEYEANSHPQLPQDDVTTMDDAKNEAEASSSSTRANRLKFFQHRRTTSSTSSSYCEYLTSSSQSSSSYAGPKPTGVDGCPLRSCLKSSSSYLPPTSCDTSVRSSTSSASSRSISFSHVQFREYCREVGDNPTVSYGCPLALGWKFNEREIVNIDSYEADRTYNPFPCQSLTSAEREKILNEIGGLSHHQIIKGQIDASFGRQLRKQSLANIGGFRSYRSVGPRERLVIMKESAARKLSRAKNGISSAQEQHELWDNAQDAARERSYMILWDVPDKSRRITV